MIRTDLDAYDIPDVPGVYFFRDTDGRILYIGKATSLRDRVRSYFSKDLSEARSAAIAAMVQEAKSISWQTTDSVLEALIVEANLIKKHQPRFNTDEKDNKSFSYLVVTKESFPRVLIVRGRELFDPIQGKDYKGAKVFGPFPQGGALKEAVKIVRKIFPFRDSCTAEIGKPCFNAQIGLCPGVCSGAIKATEYAHMLGSITDVFKGDFHGLKRRLVKEMQEASEGEDFERAGLLRKQVHALTHIRDVSLIKDDVRITTGGHVRIEAYDVAHTGGSQTVGVMVVVQDGEVQKQEYRKFTIRTKTNDDPGSLSEILSRRLSHTEWQYPRLIVVDGSIAQMRAAKKVLVRAGVEIPIVGVVKDERHKPLRISGDATIIKTHEREILLANSEAHRYAIGWHRKRMRRAQMI